MPFAYQNFDQSGDAGVTIQSLTEQNAPPLLVLWLYLTTNPGFLKAGSPDYIVGPKFQTIADQLGLTVECVQRVFLLAHNNRNTFVAVANVFQETAQTMTYAGPAGDCIRVSTVGTLAPAAKASLA